MFTYSMPTKLYFGKDAVLKNGNALLLGARALLVTGKCSAVKSGALSDVVSVLSAQNIPYLVFDEVESNPTIETTVRGGAAANAFGADFIIAIGGGSPLDAAKAIAVYAKNPPREDSAFSMMDIFSGNFPNPPLPMAAIPTTAGTGSEVTPYSILTLHSIQNKKSFSSPSVFYKVAFLDGKYTAQLPLQVARNTAIDAMSHMIEGYTNKKASPLSDYIALEGLRVLGKHLRALETGTLDETARADLLWAASLGGMVIAQTGTTVVHSMGYPLTYYKEVPHGMACGLLLGEYVRQTEKVLPEKIAAVLSALGLESPAALTTLLASLLPWHTPFSFEELSCWTHTTIEAKNVSVCPFPVSRALEEEIYKACLLR